MDGKRGITMRTVNQHKDLLKEWFYLDSDGITVRRAKDGYRGRYKKGDIVQPYKLCSHGYGGVHVPTTRTTVPYHHLLMVLRGVEISDDLVVDHIDGNTYNNDNSNIRLTTQQMNCKNKRKRCDNTSGITGINKSKDCNSYIVRKQINGKRVYLGSRPTLEEAKKLLDSYDDKIRTDGYTERHGK